MNHLMLDSGGVSHFQHKGVLTEESYLRIHAHGFGFVRWRNMLHLVL
jgi:hypothetical protein